MHLSELEEWTLQRSERNAWLEFRREGPRPERLHIPPNDDDLKELKQAYSDLTNVGEGSRRSLCYFSDALFSGSELMAAFQDVMSRAYHDFDPDFTTLLLVEEYEKEALFQPARERSISIYLHAKKSEPLPMPTPETEELLRVSELDYINASNTIIRMWWD